GAKPAMIDEVCDIIGHHHHPRSEETLNFKVVYDADLIANLEEKQEKKPLDPERFVEIIERSFLTDGGRAEAKKVLGIKPAIH
ncbi:MAG: phosphohydrolase, partial [Deltaproteobacteria bacterium]|nr:phosphohydrolase [Deltaproteobacteria bacterium]